MGGAAINVTIDDREVKAILGRIQKNLDDLTPAMKIVGSIVRTSIVRNFEKSGRPVKWKKHSAITAKRRGEGAKILMAEGLGAGLAGSIHLKAEKDRVVVGTDKIYAAVQHFGAKKGSFGNVTVVQRIGKHIRKLKSGKTSEVTAHTRTRHNVPLPWGDIPARPFMMVQDEDWAEIKDALGEYIMGIKP